MNRLTLLRFVALGLWVGGSAVCFGQQPALTLWDDLKLSLKEAPSTRSLQQMERIVESRKQFERAFRPFHGWGAGTALRDSLGQGLDRIGGQIWETKLKAYPYDTIDWSAYYKAREYRKTMSSKRPVLYEDRLNPKFVEPTDYPDGNWTFIGPKGFDREGATVGSGAGPGPYAGRIGGIAVSHQNPNSVWYVGGGNGGVVKTTDGGVTWTEITRGWDTLAIGAIAVDPSNDNIVYVGTGDYDDKNRLSAGLFKSTNGGTTWTNYGNAQFGLSMVSDIEINPENPQDIYVSTGRGESGQGGVWHSTNGGQTWTQEVTGNVRDLGVSGVANGQRFIYASVEGNSLPSKRRSMLPFSSWSDFNRPTAGTYTITAPSKVDPNRLYYVDGGNAAGLYASSDAGQTWTDISNMLPLQISLGSSHWNQANYNLVLETQQGFGSEDILYLGQCDLAVSLSSGTGWWYVGGYAQPLMDIEGSHVDNHVVTPFPNQPRSALIGNDGGLDIVYFDSQIQGMKQRILNTDAWNFAMFYTMAVNPNAPSDVMGGLQDNGIPHAQNNVSNWQYKLGADGTGTAIAPDAPNYQYATTQYMGGSRTSVLENYTIYRSNDNFATLTPINVQSVNGELTPFVPKIHATHGAQPEIYAGTSYLYRMTETGVGLPVLSRVEFPGEEITSIASSKIDPDIVYVGTISGAIYRYDDPGRGAAIRVDTSAIPDRPVTCISVSPTNSNRIVITFSGAEDPNFDRVYQCLDTLAVTPTWTSRSSGLPDVWTWWIERDPWLPSTVWYVGNELGVFYTDDAGVTWHDMTNDYGLENVSVRQLSAQQNTNRLYAATYGRGMYRMFIANTRPNLTAVNYTAASIVGGNTVLLECTFDQVLPPDGVTLTLTHSPPSVVNSPTSITVSGGDTTVMVPIVTNLVSADTTLTTTVANPFGGSLSDTVLLRRVRLANFTLSPSTVVGSYNSTGTVTLDTVSPPGGTTVTLQSDNPAVATVPPSVFVPAGQTSATFTVSTKASNVGGSASILAQLGGGIFRTINTTPLAISSVSVSPNPQTGGFDFGGTVTLPQIAGPAGVSVQLFSNSPNVVLPATVFIQGGSNNVGFLGQSAVIPGPSNQVVTITARQGFFDRTTVLTLIAIKLDGISAPRGVERGSLFPITVTLDRLAPPGGITVQLQSSNPRAATLSKSSIVIPFGQFSVTERIGRAGTVGQKSTLTATYQGVNKTTNVEVVRQRP